MQPESIQQQLGLLQAKLKVQKYTYEKAIKEDRCLSEVKPIYLRLKETISKLQELKKAAFASV
jgi:hypothetical protein